MKHKNSLPVTAEKTDEFIGTEVELNAEFWQLKKKRLIKVHKSSQMCVRLTVPFRIFRADREAVNEAEVFLLPKELHKFIRALIEYPVPFPISYSQQLSMERGMYCIRLKSQEPFKDFAERLSKALCVL